MIDDESLLDIVLQLLECPLYTTPVNNFIDKHCGVFSDAEENKIEYTLIHNEYNKVIEEVLESNLSSMGIDSADFIAACNRGVVLRDVIFDYFLAMDDFLLFKQMMVTRQRQLHLATLKAMEKAERKRKAQQRMKEREMAQAMAVIEQEDTNQLELALKLSNKITDRDYRRRQKQEEEEIEQVDRALQASLEDEELREADLRRKEAELQEAILLSVKYEKERLEKVSPAVQKSILVNNPIPEGVSNAVSTLEELATIEKKVRSLPPVKRATLPPLKVASATVPPTLEEKEPSTPTVADLASDPAARAAYVRQQRDLLIQKRMEQRDNAKKVYEDAFIKKAQVQDVDSHASTATSDISTLFSNKLRLSNSTENKFPEMSAQMLERLRVQMNQLDDIRDKLGK